MFHRAFLADKWNIGSYSAVNITADGGVPPLSSPPSFADAHSLIGNLFLLFRRRPGA